MYVYIYVCVCVEICLDELRTKVLMLGVGMFDQAEEQLGEVADDDEGRSQCWTAVVLHNQVVPLKLPEDVCVSLHHLKRVTGRTHAVFLFFLSLFFFLKFEVHSFRGPYLNMAMSRFNSSTLVTRRKITNNRMTSQLA